MRDWRRFHQMTLRLRTLFQRDRVERELDEEFQFHIEHRIELEIAKGLSPEEARFVALRAMDGLEQRKEECRDVRHLNIVDDLIRDLSYALRILRRNPVFAATAAITIALGIGASTAIFSVTNAVLLRPLPYKNPDRLILAWEERGKLKNFPFSDADFFDLRNRAKSTFEDFAAVNGYLGILPREDGTPDQVRFASVTTNFFRLTGAKIAFGRDFVDADGQPQPPLAVADPGYDPHQPMRNVRAQSPQRLTTVAILSYEFWQRRYGGNTAILGQTMGNAQIAGVLVPRFEVLLPPELGVERAPDVYTAARLDFAQRRFAILRAIGRLKDGVTLERAQSEAAVVAADLRKNYYASSGFDIRLAPMRQRLVAEVQPAILALMGTVIFLLLIACANVANLLLVRASLRERELAVRTALGGGWLRLLRQMLAEAVLLSGLGTLFGVGLAWLGIRELLIIAPSNLPRLESIAIDWRVLAFATIAGLAAAVIFGVLPALRAARPDVIRVLCGGGRAAGLGPGRLLRNSVVIAEVALSFVLLIGSGLMFRSFLELQRIDPGYDPHGLLTFRLQSSRLLLAGNSQQQRLALVREIQERLGALPGVKSVTASSLLPLTGAFMGGPWGTDKALIDQGKFQLADSQLVLPGYFETLGTQLIDGRTFIEDDNAPGRKVIVIDQFLAAKAFPSESAVGKRILTPRMDGLGWDWVEVIGVVAHQRDNSLAEPGREQIYRTDGSLGHGVARHWAIRTAGDPAKFGAAICAELAKLDRNILILEMQPMEAFVDREQAGTRFSLLLIGVFAMIAALLASVGLYGVL